MKSSRKPKPHLRAGFLGGILLAAVGCMLIELKMGRPLARLSYDAPFWFHHHIPFENLVLIYVDEGTIEKYNDRGSGTLDRRAQTALLQKLTGEHARLVLYDFIFDFTNHPPEVDDQFAQAITSNGVVVLAAAFQQETDTSQNRLLAGSQIRAPVPVLRHAARGWGLVDLDFDADGVVRHIPHGVQDHPSAVWLAARLLNAPVTRQPEDGGIVRWLNYYGPPGEGTLPYCGFDRALDPAGVPVGYFSNKLVVICSRSTTPDTGEKRDEFLNPYSLVGKLNASGAEIHATALLNLLRNEWLTRLASGWQVFLVTGLGLGVGVLLTAFRPRHAVLVAFAGGLAISLVSFYLQWRHHLWWPWMVPVAVQLPLGLVWSLGARYLLETRKRLRIRRALSAYVSPYMAEQISESAFDLALGGKVMEVTVMFTDLEGFTEISESLAPEKVADLLTTYFNKTSKTILQRNGMIPKYIGDSVMAVWGAPLEDGRQAEEAVLAAWEMVQAGRQQIAGHNLRTRVGINSGRALAGNLGSDIRFDYTVIGDVVNCASRLEGVNKSLNTEILVSDATRGQLSSAIKTRALGRFAIAGRFEPLSVHEILGLAADFVGLDAWITEFETALAGFSQRNFELAEKHFRRVIQMRGGSDGPSEFYLQQITQARETANPAMPWDGVVRLSAK